MTTDKTTSKQTPSIKDFEQWDERKEAAALADVGRAFQVKHLIKGDEYWVLVPHGRIYKLPLALSLKDFEDISNADTDAQSVETVKKIIKTFAGEDQAKEIESEPIQVMMNILNDYGALVSKSQGADLGKSSISPEPPGGTKK